MKWIPRSMLASLLLLSACRGDATTTPADAAANPGAHPAESPKQPANANMDAAIKELMAKPEQADENIEVQHILIAVQGAPRMTGVTRSKGEAKALAMLVHAEAIGGGDFDALVQRYTDDSAPGIYPLTKSGRTSMVKGFGDVGFRLKVGEIGVSPWDATASPFGWHIIKRLK